MKIEKVTSAKSIWFIDLVHLNPRGRNLYKVVFPTLVQWFGFTPPQEPYDDNKGIFLSDGEFSPTQDGRDLTGVNLTVYFNGLMAHTQTTTLDSDRFLEQVLTRLSKDGVISFRPELIRSKRYQSEVWCRPGRTLKFPDFSGFCSRLTAMAYPEEKTVEFSTVGLIFDTDPRIGVNIRKRPQFTLEKKVDQPWSENLYYSQAPLATPQHEEALNELETLLV